MRGCPKGRVSMGTGLEPLLHHTGWPGHLLRQRGEGLCPQCLLGRLGEAQLCAGLSTLGWGPRDGWGPVVTCGVCQSCDVGAVWGRRWPG